MSSSLATETLFISGGPSLRVFERHKSPPHDRFWGNFITSGMAVFKQNEAEIRASTFTWLIFRPAYERRGQEIGHDLIKEIETMVSPTGARIVWFHDRDSLLDYLHKGQDRNKIKISRLEYFGHSNKRNWCFDYSNFVDGAVMESMCLHVKHLPAIKSTIFSPNAFTRSWGCHSGEEYSQAWFAATRTRMWGAVGKTDYSTGGVPKLSNSGGSWVQ
ncbi:MAG: hypothetical protein ACFCUX_02260 [Candidatus Methylacidiphilales bacterium]